MVKPLLEAHTEWVETDDGKRLKWVCPECDNEYYKNRRHTTIQCQNCDRIMQAANFDTDSNPDKENPREVLRSIAKRRGLPYDYYYPDDEHGVKDPLEW